jgi:DUF971 family protein
LLSPIGSLVPNAAMQISEHHGVGAGTELQQGTLPSAVTVSRDRLDLTLTWATGDTTRLAAATLRVACRCAWCRRDRILGCFPACFDDVAITRLEPVGSHALHIAFSDSHARGLFPWTYLRDLADGIGLPDEGLAATQLLGCPTTSGPAAIPSPQDRS